MTKRETDGVHRNTMKCTTPAEPLYQIKKLPYLTHNSLFFILLALIAFEAKLLLPARQSDWSPAQHSAKLRLGPLNRVTRARLFTLALTIPLAFVSPWLALPVLLATELCSRHLFFRTVQAPKMPGGLN